MGAKATKFSVSIAIQARDFASRVLRGVGEGVRRFGAKVASSIRGIVDFGAKLGVVFATWGAGLLNVAGKIANVVMETSDLLSKISDLSAKTGISTDTLQELAWAAGQTGVETEALGSGIEAMSRKFGDMAAGGKELSGFLLRVGGPAFLKQAKAAKTNEERLDLMLVALGKIEDPAKKAAFAAKVFGKSGEDMVKMLGSGVEGLQKLRSEAHKFGGVQGPEAIAAAEEFGDEMAKVGSAWKGAKSTFGAEVMRQLLPQLKAMTDWIAKNPAKIREIAKELATGVVSAVTAVRDGIKWIYDNGATILSWAKALAIIFGAGGILGSIKGIVGGLRTMIGLGGALGKGGGGGGGMGGGWFGKLFGAVLGGGIAAGMVTELAKTLSGNQNPSDTETAVRAGGGPRLNAQQYAEKLALLRMFSIPVMAQGPVSAEEAARRQADPFNPGNPAYWDPATQRQRASMQGGAWADAGRFQGGKVQVELLMSGPGAADVTAKPISNLPPDIELKLKKTGTRTLGGAR